MRTRNIHKAALTDAVTPLEEAGKEIAYQAAVEGIVLLENDGCLPLKPGKIALYGAGAKMTIKGGTGSGEVNERHAVSILEGMEDAAKLEGLRQQIMADVDKKTAITTLSTIPLYIAGSPSQSYCTVSL